MSVQSSSKYCEAYHKQVVNNKRAKDKSLAKVFDIITDLTDRRGLRQEWENIDGDIQDEIIEKWVEIINKK
jgi:glycine/serine hydroxymethyltransferase